MGTNDRWWGVSATYPQPSKPESATSVEVQLKRHKRQIMIRMRREGMVTSRWCRNTFGVSYDTANRDLIELIGMGLVVRVGKGRSTRYVLKAGDRSDA